MTMLRTCRPNSLKLYDVGTADIGKHTHHALCIVICVFANAGLAGSLQKQMIFAVVQKGETMDDDRCYECTGYGDDYYYDEDTGEYVSACDECPYAERWEA